MFDTDKAGWSIVKIKGLPVIIFKKYCISYSEIDFVLASSAQPDEILPCAAFHMGLHCLPKLPFRGFLS